MATAKAKKGILNVSEQKHITHEDMLTQSTTYYNAAHKPLRIEVEYSSQLEAFIRKIVREEIRRALAGEGK